MSRARHITSTLRRLGPAGAVIALASILPGASGVLLLALLPIIAPPLRHSGPMGALLAGACFAVSGGAMLAPLNIFNALCGYCFGTPLGVATALCAITSAAMLNYLWARQVVKNRVSDLIADRPEFCAVVESLLHSSPLKALCVVTLLRLPPGSPFALTNVLLAATKVRPLTVLAGTLLGLLPRTVVVVSITAAVGSLDAAARSNPWVWAGGIAVTLAALGILGMLSRRALRRATATMTG